MFLTTNKTNNEYMYLFSDYDCCEMYPGEDLSNPYLYL